MTSWWSKQFHSSNYLFTILQSYRIMPLTQSSNHFEVRDNEDDWTIEDTQTDWQKGVLAMMTVWDNGVNDGRWCAPSTSYYLMLDEAGACWWFLYTLLYVVLGMYRHPQKYWWCSRITRNQGQLGYPYSSVCRQPQRGIIECRSWQ